jgi:hypothetical protein
LLKSKSQYQAAPVSAADAARSIDWAARLLESAQSVAVGYLRDRRTGGVAWVAAGSGGGSVGWA